MLSNKKGILILVISLVAIYLLIYIISIVPTGKKYKNTVFLGESTKVSIKDGSIFVYNEDKKISKQKAKIYFNKKFIDGYIISGEGESSGTENSYYYYNSDGDVLVPGSIVVAVAGDDIVNIKEGRTQEIKSLDSIQDLLDLNNLISNDDVEIDLNYGKIDSIDVDGDKIEDKIYSFGLIKSVLATEDEDYISFVYLKKGNSSEYILLQNFEGSYDGISNERLSFAKLIDFDNDDNYEIVVERMMGEYGPYYYELYNYEDNKFIKLGGE